MNLSTFKAKSPEILLGVGIATVIGGVITAVIATHKAEKIISEHHEKMDEIGKAIEKDTNQKGEVANNDEYRREIAVENLKTAGKLALLYSVPAVLTTTGIICFTKSYSITKARLIAMTSAYTSLNAAFQKYRQRVIADQGEDADYKYRYGVTREIQDVVEEDGTVTQETMDIIDAEGLTEWGIIFDREHSSAYDDNVEYCETFIRQQLNSANDLYFARSSNHEGITMNEIYRFLGCDHTAQKPSTKPEGQIFGYIDNDGVGGIPYFIKHVFVDDGEGRKKKVFLIDFCLPEMLYGLDEMKLVDYEKGV